MTTAEYESLVKALTDAEVRLTDDNGELRSTYDILADIARVWDDLDNNKRASLAETLAGTRQQNIFYSIIGQFKEATGAMEAMEGSAGSLQKSYDVFMDSMQAHINQFKAAFDGLSMAVVNSQLLSFLVDVGTAIVSVLSSIFGLINFILGGLKQITTSSVDYAAAVESANDSYAKVKYQIDELLSKTEELTAQEKERLDTLIEEERIRAREVKETTRQLYNDKYGPTNDSMTPVSDMVSQYFADYRARMDQLAKTYPGDTKRIAGLQNAADEAKRKILEIKADMESFGEVLGTDLPSDAKDAMVAIHGFEVYLEGGDVALKQYYDAVNAARNGIVMIGKSMDDVSEGTEENINASIDGILHELMMMEKLGGTVDMINRRVIEINDKNYEIAKTWGFAEDTIGSVMTLASQTYQDGDAAIVVTPILPNGKLLTQDELDKYVDGLIDKATDGNYAKHDNLGLIMGVFADGSTWDENLQKADQFAIRAHELHEQLIDLAGSLGNANMEGANLYDLLAYLSEKATGVDKAVEGVTKALNDYGNGTIEVYDAMVALETELNGSTNDLYDFETATLKVDSSLISSKESLIDFIDTNRQISFSTAISELEKLETSFWSVAGSIMASKEAAIQMAQVLSFTTGGSFSVEETTIPGMKNGAISERLEKLREEKAAWDLWIESLRQRSGYRANETEEEKEKEKAEKEVDLELERLKSIVALRKEELSFLEASGDSTENQVAKMREIQKSLHDQAEHMRGVLSTMVAQGATQAEINAQEESILSLSTEWWKIQNDINELLHDDVDTLSVYKDRISLLKAELDFMEARGDADSDRILKMREIQAALHEEAEAIRATEAYTKGEASALQSVVELGTEWWNLQNKIKELSEETLTNEKELLENMKSGMDKVLSLVIELIKKQKDDEVQALEDQKTAYRQIIDLRKKALDQSKTDAKYQKDIAKQLESMAELQRKINSLDLDDSREAQNEKAKLLKELEGLQESLAETQADHAIDAQEESLDKMQDAFEEEKDSEIKVVKDSVSSYQKLYDLAIDYIDKNWDSLYDDLIRWNTEYGSELNSTITSAWDECLKAAERYGSYVEALNNIDYDIANADTKASSGTQRTVASYVSEMKQNSNEWNRRYNEGVAAGRDPAEMRRELNSSEEIKRLHTRNIEIINILRGDPYNLPIEYDEAHGKYYIVENGVRNELYTKYPQYHSGGIVEGRPSAKQDEVLALLKNGETVLTERQGEAMYRIVDIFATLGDKLGKFIDGSRVKSIFASPLPQARFASAIDAINANGSGGTTIEHMEITAPIYVSEKLDEEDIRRHARTIGATAAEYIREGFTKRNVTGPVFGM